MADLLVKQGAQSKLVPSFFFHTEINKTNYDLLRRIRQLEAQIEGSRDDAKLSKDLSSKMDQQQKIIERYRIIEHTCFALF